MRALALLLLTGCVHRGPWIVLDATWPEAQGAVEAAIRVSGDGHGHLRAGGVIEVIEQQEDLNRICHTQFGSGCSTPGHIWVLHRLAAPVLPHELCHLGLVAWSGGPFGGWRWPSEAQADACAREVTAEWLPAAPTR